MQQPRINIGWYILADVAICLFTWVCFYYLRTVIYEYPFNIPSGFFLGLMLYTIGYLSLHFLSGTYTSLYQKSRFAEITKSIVVIFIGCLTLLFFFILKNPQTNNNYYYQEFFSLLLPMLACTLLIRMLFLKVVKKQMQTKKVFFNSMLIGSGKRAEEFFDAFSRNSEQGGYRITSFYNTNGKSASFLPPTINKYDHKNSLSAIIEKEKIEEVIIAVEKNERELLTNILQNLSNQEINIKITPDTVDIISGALQTNNVMGVPLIDIHSGLLPNWQQNIKRAIDILASLTALVALLPLLLYTLLRVVFSSKGPIFYSQERLGFKGRPFMMYKFRSMYINAEPNGPQLSWDNDERITSWGRIMRKWRL
ncbi:MAG: sugar transferase, partial [Ferruginibacter sp.]